MADGRIEIDTSINTGGIDKGLSSLKKNLSAVGNSQTAKGLSNIGATVAGIAGGFGLAAKAIGTTVKTVGELVSAYNKQAGAEKQLEQAAKNNPYLTEHSVARLKEYAGALQKVSTTGDEELLPFMAQLAAAGRTQSEIQDIMSAALDVSASGAMSLESAVRNLNKTYSGMSGELGETIPQVKALTAEQLKSGEAVKVVAAAYSGMSETLAKSTGGWQQFKNSFGDFKETLGSGLAKAQNQAGKALSGFFDFLSASFKKTKSEAEDLQETLARVGSMDDGATAAKMQGEIDALKEKLKTLKEIEAAAGGNKSDFVDELSAKAREAKKELNGAEKAVEKLTDKIKLAKQCLLIASDAAVKKQNEEDIKKLTKELTEQQARVSLLTDANDNAQKAAKNALQSYSKNIDEFLKSYSGSLNLLAGDIEKTQAAIKTLEDAAAAKKKQEIAEESYRQTIEKENAAKEKANQYARENNRQLAENLALLEATAKAKGEEVSAQEKYNVYLQSYIDLMTKTEGAIKEGYPVEQARLEQLKAARKAVDEAADAEEKLAAAIRLTQQAAEALNDANKKLTLKEELEAELKSLEEIKAKIKETSEEEIAAAQAGLEEKLTKAQIIAGLEAEETRATIAKVDAISEKEKEFFDENAARRLELLELKKAIDESEILSEEEKTAQLKRIDEEYAQIRGEQFSQVASEISGYVDQAAQIVTAACDLMETKVKNEQEAEEAAIELKYRRGEISEEEYNEEITKAKKKAAKEQYKIQMWQWTVSMIQAAANIAEGVTKSLSQGIPVGLINMGTVLALGGIQLGSLAAAKPIPPSFSTGGIIAGSSYNGDNIAANLNSREMIMNMAQQKSLWDFINGGGKSGGMRAGGVNIAIHNSAANIVNAEPQITKDKIEIMIDARVNEGLKKGRYGNSLTMAQQGMTGEYYGI